MTGRDAGVEDCIQRRLSSTAVRTKKQIKKKKPRKRRATWIEKERKIVLSFGTKLEKGEIVLHLS